MKFDHLLWSCLLLLQSQVILATWKTLYGLLGSSSHPAQSTQSSSTTTTNTTNGTNQSTSSPNQATSPGIPRSTSRGSAIGGAVNHSSPMVIRAASAGSGIGRGSPLQRQSSNSYGSGSGRFSYDPMVNPSSPTYVEGKRYSSQNGESTSSISPRFHSDTSFELRDVEKFALLYRDVEEILSVPYYFVDKSLFIKRVIEDPANLLIFCRPRLTGKSINASLLARFLDYKHERSPGFRRRLAIHGSEHSGLVQRYAGQYVVIMVYWAESGVMRASSSHEFKLLLIQYLQALLRDELSKLAASLAQLDKHLPSHISLFKLLQTDSIWDCTSILGVLALTMATASENQVVIIVDDYDLVLRKAGELGIYGNMVKFLTRFYDQTATIAQGHIWKMVAFGTHRLQDDAPFSSILLNMKDRPVYNQFGAVDKYFYDFGFTGEEVKAALTDNRSKLTMEEMDAWYKIPESGNMINLLYHPFSVASAINHDQLDQYWTREAPLDMHAFPMRCLTDWGPGDFTLIFDEPSSPTLGWSFKCNRLNYDHDCAKGVGRAQVLSWMRDAGYISKGQVVSQEQSSHLFSIRNGLLNDQTGLIRAILALRHPAEPNPDPLRDALESVLALPNFAGGKPTDQFPGHTITDLIHDLISSHLPCLDWCRPLASEQRVSLIALDKQTVLAVGVSLAGPDVDVQFVRDTAYRATRMHRPRRTSTLCYWLNVDNRIAYVMGEL